MSLSMQDAPEEQYSDFEVHSIRHRQRLGPGEQNSAAKRASIFETGGPPGIDNDELAEAAVLRVQAKLALDDQDTATNTTPGSALAQWSMGADVDTSDSAALGGAPSGDEIVVSGPGDLINNETNEPGILYEAALTTSPAFNDTTNGTGGGADYQVVSEIINFRELLGTGPFFDTADDLRVESQLLHNALGGRSFLDIHATVYWQIWEMEDRRARLSLSD